MVKHIWNSEHLFKTFDTVSVHETAVHIIGIHDIKSPRALISALKFSPYFSNNTNCM